MTRALAPKAPKVGVTRHLAEDKPRHVQLQRLSFSPAMDQRLIAHCAMELASYNLAAGILRPAKLRE
jgi:hypothetical protein